MIWFLKWEILDINEKEILILTSSWVWYSVNINEKIFANLSIKKECELFIYEQITENSKNLFGFISLDEKKVFTELIKISWIWWKVAINILNIWLDNLAEAVVNEDNKAIEAVNWIWKKWASKVILELKDKDIIKSLAVWKISSWKEKKNISLDRSYDEIIESLVNMWFDEKSVIEILSKKPEEIATPEEIMPYVIRKISLWE